MSFKFKPEDFSSEPRGMIRSDYASYVANLKLDEWKVDATVVYGASEEVTYWTERQFERDTHRALLIDIQELPKEPCKHEPSGISSLNGSPWSGDCKHCGVKLQATWSEVGE